MNPYPSKWSVTVVLSALVLSWTAAVSPRAWGAPARAPAELQKRATWQAPTAEQVETQLNQFLTEVKADESVREQAQAAWKRTGEAAGEEAILDRVVAAVAAADPRAAELVTAVQTQGVLSDSQRALLSNTDFPAFARHNLQLAYGRTLAQQSHFDEALEQLSGLTLDQVVDPTALLFYQAVSYHRLLKKEECLTALGKLLENEARLPQRYATVAKLMEADIRPLEADSLDEVARLMSDIRRRLDFGHAGKRVRKQEDDVIAKLDKMIKDMEDQMQQMQAAAAGQSSNPQSSNPAQDSQNLGGKGPGDVDQKSIGNKSGWGNLPPKEREQALQQISKDLPAHYREAIEEYFRKLSRDGDE